LGPCYAGIGSRETPEAIRTEMQTIAMTLCVQGWVLRSGGAKGADEAFEKGCDLINARRKIVRTATSHQPALTHAAQFHPDWGACTDVGQALHARNSLVMMGDWLDNPVKFVVCWTPDGAVTGGTGQALRIAEAYKIPVFNLAVTPVAALWEHLHHVQ